LKVKAGDVVQAGQVLGLVATPGTPPARTCTSTSWTGRAERRLLANGLPYVFDRFDLTARVTGLESDPPNPVRGPARGPLTRTGQYPLTGDIMTLP
jgi:hypothetical protein